MSHPKTRTVRQAGLTYFGIVFGCGFVLGFVRVLWLVPRLGERGAELIELPLMLVVIGLTARWLVRRHPSLSVGSFLAVGGLALALLLIAELSLAWGLSGLDPIAYVVSRDPVSGSAYAMSLLVFVLAPAAVRRLR